MGKGGVSQIAAGGVFILGMLAFFACSDLGGLTAGNESGKDASADRKVANPDAAESEDGAIVCDEGKTACGALCSDLSNDSQNCGRCGHDCLGAKCVQGACEPITLASGLNIPQGIAIDKNDVYVTVYGSGDVIRIPKVGGPPQTITGDTLSPFGIALDLDGTGLAKKVVWGESRLSSSQLLYCTLPDCPTIGKVPAAEDVRYVAVSNGVAYWTQSGTGAGSVRKCSLSNCTQPTLVSNEIEAEGLAVHDAVVVITRRQVAGSARRMTTSGGGAIDLIPTLDNPTGITTDGTMVFVAVNGGSAIAKCPLLGCTGPSTFAFATSPHEVAMDAQNVYWGNGLASGGSIAYCAVAGCEGGKPKILVPDQKNPFGIAVDDKAIYWTNSSAQGSVMKIAKP
jgi:hypothetical protein